MKRGNPLGPRPGSDPLQAGSGGLGFWCRCSGAGGPGLAKQTGISTGTDQQDSASTQKHMAQIFPSHLGEWENVDKIAEMDLRGEEDSLFHAGWHFQRGDKAVITVSSQQREDEQSWITKKKHRLRHKI